MRLALAIGVMLTGVAGPWQAPPEVRLVAVPDRAGISFRHELGDGGTHITESPGSGGAWIDYDVDGDIDLMLINGLPARDSDPVDGRGHALFRNSGGHFERTPRHSGVTDKVWGVGIAVADVDNDGFPDLLITALGPDRLYRNNGDGTFSRTAAGVEDPGWGTSAVFTDWDQDGFVDLYVVRYLDVELTAPRLLCFDQGEEKFCGPMGRKGQSDIFYRNNGAQSFERWYEFAVDPDATAGFAVVATDCDGDLLPEIYVANDSHINLLFRRHDDGDLEDQGLISGAGYSGDGRGQAGMAASAADIDGDGRFELFVSNFQDDHNTLYDNLGDCIFEDTTARYGLAASSLPYMGWGAQFVDLDGDADPDLVVVNGHIYLEIGSPDAEQYEQRNLLYLNQLRETGTARFIEVGAAVGGGLMQQASSRALIRGDYDNDGDADLLVTNVNEQPTLLRNDGAARWPSLRLTLIGRTSNRSALGARVRVTAADVTQSTELRGSEGYLASNDFRLLFHLPGSIADEVEIIWPGGDRTLLGNQAAGWLVIDQDRGVVARRSP